MGQTPTTETPSRLWYAGHVFFWVMTGLARWDGLAIPEMPKYLAAFHDVVGIG